MNLHSYNQEAHQSFDLGSPKYRQLYTSFFRMIIPGNKAGSHETTTSTFLLTSLSRFFHIQSPLPLSLVSLDKFDVGLIIKDICCID